MTLIDRHHTITLNIQLSPEQAVVLKLLVQNPIVHEESKALTGLRKKIWNALPPLNPKRSAE